MLFFRKYFRRVATVIGTIAAIFLFINSVIGFIGVALLILVGPWDLLVWLTNSDWKTTNFAIPLLGLVLIIAVAIIGHGVLGPILDWAEGIEEHQRSQDHSN